ncbi:MAG: hypothetical protein L0Z50_37370, partial [Verrucomicrobiales bacterium]|nr:hypothetical protein [Verrucomicrobiales bacterium]
MRLNLVATSMAHAEALVKEIGSEKVDCADLSREDCDVLLLQLNEVHVLRGLNIHETLDGHRVRIGQHTYVDDESFSKLPAEFNTVVTRLRDHPGYARFRTDEEANCLVNKLRWPAVIEIALSRPRPVDWWEVILSAIGRRESGWSELRGRVREIAWLPTADVAPVKPADLLHVPGAELELDRLPSDVLSGRVPVLRLAAEVREHERFEIFKGTVLPRPDEALATLATLLNRHAGWCTGLSGEFSAEQVADWITSLGDTSEQTLPIARLVKAFHGESSVRELLPEFLKSIRGQLTPLAYAVILKHLAEGHVRADTEIRQRMKSVFLRYLGSIDAAGADFARGVLVCEGVRLLSAAGEWKSVCNLAPPRAGISALDTVDMHFAKSPRNLIATCGQAEVPQTGNSVRPDAGTWSAMASQVRGFFEPWRQHLPSPEPIGAFLSLFSLPEPMVRLAKEYFQSHGMADVHRWLDQRYPKVRERLDQQFKQQMPFVEVQTGKTIRVRSLLGTEFEARRDQNPTTLILGGDPCFSTGAAMLINGVMYPGNRRRILRLLPVDPIAAGLSVPAAVRLLQTAAEQVIERTIGTEVTLTDLFDQLSKASQVEVQVAQSLVIEGAVGLLRQIGGHVHTGIKEALAAWDEARREEATADSLGIRDQQKRAEEKRRDAKRRIRDLLEKDDDVHHALRGEVRKKLRDHYRYDASSVPFELWQNADDALLELEQLTSQVSTAQESGFLLDHALGAVEFVHFGRLINEFRVAGGPNPEGSAFNRDLEKMVVQSISDKTEVSNRTGTTLTGKFGLGFKSVFLVSDAPEVLSGSVDFIIRGGIYPVRLAESRRERLLMVLQAVAPDEWRRGTVINLPLRPDAPAGDEFLALFRRLAPLLLVFSNRLKRVRFLTNGHLTEDLRWRPKTLLNSGCEFGELTGLSGEVTAASALSSNPQPRKGRVTFLLGMNEEGFIPLPADVPVFWVTAPTRATPGYGFAVNGPFEPDVGRVQLAHKSERNQQLADELAQVLSMRFGALWQRAASAWEEFREELRLAANVSSCDFWQSLWDVLGRRFAEKCAASDGSIEAPLARRIVWGSDATGLRRFYADFAALPTGLLGEHRTLTNLGKVCFVADGALDRESVFRTVSGWKGFQQRVAVGAICSGKQVASVLERLGAPLREVERVHLATAVEWELGEEKRADAELATLLGQLITPEFMTGLEKGQAGEREESEHKRVIEVLREVAFQAADGSWHNARELVVADQATEVEKDEVMRTAFAPSECRLNPAYIDNALRFFLASRSRLEADVERMAEWVLKARDQTTQEAALHYLLNGDLRHALADRLRLQRDAGKWLWKLESFDWFKTKFSEDQRRELLAHVLKLFEEKLRELTGTGGDQKLELPQQLPKHIWTVEEIWKWWDAVGKPTDEYVMEGTANWRLFHARHLPDRDQRRDLLKSELQAPTSKEGAVLWYRLFGYACLLSAGRQSAELREFWMERLAPSRFWERTAVGDFSEQTKELFAQAVTSQFTDLNAGGEAAYFWRRVFYDVRKVRRMVRDNDFPGTL